MSVSKGDLVRMPSLPAAGTVISVADICCRLAILHPSRYTSCKLLAKTGGKCGSPRLAKQDSCQGVVCF
jgi:hypothetical protein